MGVKNSVFTKVTKWKFSTFTFTDPSTFSTPLEQEKTAFYPKCYIRQLFQMLFLLSILIIVLAQRLALIISENSFSFTLLELLIFLSN